MASVLQTEIGPVRSRHGALGMVMQVAQLVPWGTLLETEEMRFESSLGESSPKPAQNINKENKYGRLLLLQLHK